MSARVAGQRFRQRKLSVKQNLSIIREEDITELLDDEAQRNMPKIETGVDKGEEIEHHLQAVISATAAGVKKESVYIPTPPTNISALQSERLYQPRFQQPQTYIRSSSTVEDSIGCPYDMNSDDDVFLKQLNSKKPRSKQCSEDQFEIVMNFFEQTAALKQPFAHVDNTPVLSFEDMELAYDETIDESCRTFAKDIYEHWKARRQERSNEELMPSLKIERSETKDSEDPFVCFRRREFRQARKTRGRDAQSSEKLKKLRSELELARQLVHMTRQREYLRREQIAQDRAIFEKRIAVKESKRNLGIKDDDEDLITQKPQAKPKPKLDASIIQRGMPGMVPKAPLTGGDRPPPDAALAQLSEERARKHAEIDNMVIENMKKHKQWNTDWVDNTWRPITPPLDNAVQSTYRSAVTEFLPTPPASVSDDELETADTVSMLSRKPSTEDLKKKSMIRYASPPTEIAAPRPSYRKRVGRGGRIFVDRRGLKRSHAEANDDIDDRLRERFDYDQDSEDDNPMYYNDPYGEWNIKYRIAFLSSMPRDPSHQAKMLEEAQRRQQQAASQNAAVNGSAAAGARAALPSAQAMRPPS